MDQKKEQTHPEVEDQFFITREQACKRYALSLRFLSDLIEQGVLPHVRLGRKCIRIPLREADAKMMSLMTGGAK